MSLSWKKHEVQTSVPLPLLLDHNTHMFQIAGAIFIWREGGPIEFLVCYWVHWAVKDLWVCVKPAHWLACVLKTPRSRIKSRAVWRTIETGVPRDGPGRLGVGHRLPNIYLVPCYAHPGVLGLLCVWAGDLRLLCVCRQRRWRGKKRQEAICYVSFLKMVGLASQAELAAPGFYLPFPSFFPSLLFLFKKYFVWEIFIEHIAHPRHCAAS